MSQILYPLAFKECVEKESAVYNIPPHLIYSVIKAESNYIPEAVSSAGATGLMQLM
ncbi:MAG: lytic transglycosylase domain-containing protein, partial [Clostridia bacterium]|nr:lytic transglycosylase domain-containing protein [Clostridia bacterium]